MRSTCFGPQLASSKYCPIFLGSGSNLSSNHQQPRLHFRLEEEAESVPEPENQAQDSSECDKNAKISGPGRIGFASGSPESRAHSKHLYQKLQREVEKLDPDVSGSELSSLKACIEGCPSDVLNALQRYRRDLRSQTPVFVIDRMIEIAELLVQLERSSQNLASRTWANYSPDKNAGGSTTRTTVIYRQQEVLLVQHAQNHAQSNRFGLLLGQAMEDQSGPSPAIPMTPRTSAKISELLRRRYASAVEKCKPKFRAFFPSLEEYTTICQQDTLHPSVVTEIAADKADAMCYMQAIEGYRQQQPTINKRK